MKTVRIDDLLQWAFVREKVELARPPGLNLGVIIRPRGFPKSASSECIGAAVGSSANLGFEAPRDAYAVASAVEGCGAARLVRIVAKGDPPDWTPYPDIHWEKGPPMYGRYGKKRHRLVGYVVFARGELPAIVDERRKVYRSWASSIARLHVMLAEPGALQDHVLDQWLPPLEPWIKTVA